MIELSYDDIVRAGREYYEAGLLSAQGPAPMCAYRDSTGLPCVIGAAISDYDVDQLTIKELPESPSVQQLYHVGILKMPTQRDMTKARQLQFLHDEWATRAAIHHVMTKGYEEAFRRELYGENDASPHRKKRASVTSADQGESAEESEGSDQALDTE